MRNKPTQTVHVSAMIKGEEAVLKKREPGRDDERQFHSVRDATGINSKIERLLPARTAEQTEAAA